MTIQRIPIVSSVDPEAAGGGIVTGGAGTKNCYYSKYSDGRVYGGQRPAINLREKASDVPVGTKGRGVVFWDNVEDMYIVNNDTVYKGGYSLPLAQKLSPGRDPVFMLEADDGIGGSNLVILDPENNEGWYINSSVPTTMIKIVDAVFTAITLAGGGVSLDGYIFVMDIDGTIWNSNINNPTVWGGLDFINASREADKGVFLTKHHDHVVAMGSKSIEFFTDVGNPVGSPLERRSDIFYNTGVTDYKHVFNSGDNIFFLGAERIGTIGVFGLSGFKTSKLSTDEIDFFINNTLARSKFDFLVSGGYVGEHYSFYMTAVDPNSGNEWIPTSTLVYDATNKLWTEFETIISDPVHPSFSIIQTSERGDPTSLASDEAVLMFSNGDLGIFSLVGDLIDSSGQASYMEWTAGDALPDGEYVVNEDDYVQDIGQDIEANIELIIRTGEADFDTMTDKFTGRLALVGTTVAGASGDTDIMVSWSDDHYNTFSAERPIDTGMRRMLSRCGRFKRRAHQIRYAGTDAIRIEAVELDVRASQYSQR